MIVVWHVQLRETRTNMTICYVVEVSSLRVFPTMWYVRPAKTQIRAYVCRLNIQ